MNEIGELNIAIATLKSECEAHTDCKECPMRTNCGMGNGVPCDWKKIEEKDGAEVR